MYCIVYMVSSLRFVSFRNKVEAELANTCGTILMLLDKFLIPSAQTGESKVFYFKMKGDYHRYISEFTADSNKAAAAEAAHVVG